MTEAPGISWGDLVGALVDAHGTLTAVAWKLVDRADGDDVASVERALRRLRTRGQHDGGVWGQRVLRVFGVPVAIEDRVRWMGHYHSSFNDLPVALCVDQLRLWDRPPVSESRARVWVHLGFASCALRTRELDTAMLHVGRASSAIGGADAPPRSDELGAYDSARLEMLLIEAYVESRRDAGRVAALLDRAGELLARATLGDADRACFQARLVDHRAYAENHGGDPNAGFALYQSLPEVDVHPFASYRRDAGLAYGLHRAGRTTEALALARRACAHAGDGGYTRLRAMGLVLLSVISGDAAPLERARAIALRLGDGELLARVDQRALGRVRSAGA